MRLVSLQMILASEPNAKRQMCVIHMRFSPLPLLKERGREKEAKRISIRSFDVVALINGDGIKSMSNVYESSKSSARCLKMFQSVHLQCIHFDQAAFES